MDDLKRFVASCKRSFTPREMADYEEYLAELLGEGFLQNEEAEEAACCRVLQERRS